MSWNEKGDVNILQGMSTLTMVLQNGGNYPYKNVEKRRTIKEREDKEKERCGLKYKRNRVSK